MIAPETSLTILYVIAAVVIIAVVVHFVALAVSPRYRRWNDRQDEVYERRREERARNGREE
jgi:hypothetical protein